MEEKKPIRVSLGTLILVIIIVLLIVALVGMYYYFNFVKSNNNSISNNSVNTAVHNDVTENIEKEENVNSVVNQEKIDSVEPSDGDKKYISYKDVVGCYSAVEKLKNSNIRPGEDDSAFYSLYLTDAGTYSYEQGVVSPTGTVGNYIIDGNKIILNILFHTNSSAEVMAMTGTIELTFNEDGTITDSKGIEGNSVVLKKDETENIENRKDIINQKIQETQRYTL